MKKEQKNKVTLLSSCWFFFSINFLSNRPLAHVCIETLIISFTPIRCNGTSLHWWMGQISAFAYVDYNLFRNNYALTLGKYCSMKFRCNKHFSFIDQTIHVYYRLFTIARYLGTYRSHHIRTLDPPRTIVPRGHKLHKR